MKIKILIPIGFQFFFSVFLFGQGMIVEPNAYVAVKNGGKLIITDATNGKLRIKSTSAGTGSLLVDNTAGSALTVPSNNTFVERYLSLDAWHYISSPITSALSGVFLWDYLMTSDPTTATGWGPYIVPTDVPLQVMRGYAVWKPTSNAGWPEVFDGNLNGNAYNDSYSISIERNPATQLKWPGWHLVGNPYPCAINLASSGVSWGEIEPAAWFWNGGAGNYQATVAQVPDTGIYHGGMHSDTVPPMQGFYVHIKSSYSGTTTLTLNNSARVQGKNSFLKIMPSSLLVLKVQGYENEYYDLASVQFNPEATPGYDPGYDAYKLYGLTEAPQLYTLVNDTSVTCNSLPFTKADMAIPMGFSCGIAGNYTLIVQGLGSFDPNVAINLEDLKLNKIQSLRSNPVYNFSYATTDNSNRFILHFDNPYFGISDLQTDPDPLQIYSYGNFIYIRQTGKGAVTGVISVYDLLGRNLYADNLTDIPLSKYELNLNEGYYVVKVVTNESSYSRKVFISR
jgi:hypothetical protein